MSNTTRAVIVSLFALFGAWVAVSTLPPVIETLYDNLTKVDSAKTDALSQRAPTTVTKNPPKADNTQGQNPTSQVERPEGASGTETTTPNTAPKDGDKPGDQPGDKPEQPKTGNQSRPSTNPTSTPDLSDTTIPIRVNIPAVALLGLMVGAVMGSLVLRQLDGFADKWEKTTTGDRITIFVGSFVGVIAGIIVSLPFQVAFQGKAEGALITLGLIVGCGAGSVYVLRTMGDVLPWESSTQTKRRTGIKIFDTNVLIDGRIYDLVRTGFVDGELYVPNFVLLELQHIADSADSLRRQRGRRGLEVLRRIQSEFEVTVGVHDKYAGNEKDEVDTRLVKLAKAVGGDLVSNDFNLNRVATIQEVRVLNINELALALRPTILPGEPVEVAVVKEGSQYGQGVGYLDDGTMVVVEHGRHLIGETVVAPVSQVIQTERGKMIFADASEISASEPEEQAPSPRQRFKPSR